MHSAFPVSCDKKAELLEVWGVLRFSYIPQILRMNYALCAEVLSAVRLEAPANQLQPMASTCSHLGNISFCPLCQYGAGFFFLPKITSQNTVGFAC